MSFCHAILEILNSCLISKTHWSKPWAVTMGVEKVIRFFHARFKGISRPDRERLLCAMIRINYGTPWDGDLKILQNFFPQEFHNRLVLDGLTHLIEALSPFADEPTDPGVIAAEETKLHETTERLPRQADALPSYDPGKTTTITLNFAE